MMGWQKKCIVCGKKSIIQKVMIAGYGVSALIINAGVCKKHKNVKRLDEI